MSDRGESLMEAQRAILEAAERWLNELGEEIIPGAAEEEQAGYQHEHDILAAAIELWREYVI